jgi:Ferritin-like domain
MDGTSELTTRGRWLRGAFGGAVAVAGGVALNRLGGASAAQGGEDPKILDLFLTLERVQDAFYRQALKAGHLSGELLKVAQTVSPQESAHVKLLEDKLGSQASARPDSDFGDALSSNEKFRDAAIDLEEAAIAAYLGQAANLTRSGMVTVATLMSVEARQVAWLRDLKGVSPAPRAADPPRPAEDVLDELRQKGYIR